MRRMDPGRESRGVHEQVVPAPDADLGEQDGAIEDVPGGVLNELEADGLAGEHFAERHGSTPKAQAAAAVEPSCLHRVGVLGGYGALGHRSMRWVIAGGGGLLSEGL